MKILFHFFFAIKSNRSPAIAVYRSHLIFNEFKFFISAKFFFSASRFNASLLVGYSSVYKIFFNFMGACIMPTGFIAMLFESPFQIGCNAGINTAVFALD